MTFTVTGHGPAQTATVHAENGTAQAVFDCPGVGQVVGFENHSGKTWLSSGVQPLGRVLAGFGNNGEDGTEGVRFNNVFGTYSHGPVLPKNPQLCDFILGTALERKGERAELEPLDDSLENAAHEVMAAKMRK